MERLRVLLVNTGHQNPRAHGISPPIGLAYLASYARTHCTVDIRILDQRAEDSSNKSVIDRACAWEPDIIGFRCLTADAHLLGQLCDGAKTALPNALLLAGGPHASAAGAAVLEQTTVDAVIVGEGEETFRMLIEAWAEKKRKFGGIPGLIWRDSSGEIRTNPGAAPIVEDLDTLPLPAYDLLDLSWYWRGHNMTIAPFRKYLSLFTSRGCPYRCTYCHGLFGKRFRANSAERVADEMQYYTKTFGVRDFDFYDDVFNFNPQRVKDIAALVTRRNMKVKIAFPNALRTDILTPEIVDALKAMGTYYSGMALETGSPRLQKMIEKNLNIPKFLDGVKMMSDHHIFTIGFVMMGFPTETEAELEETIDVACRSYLHSVAFFTLMPYPGTQIYEEVKRTSPNKLAQFDFQRTDYVYHRSTNVSDVPDDVLVAYMRKAYQRFYMNPWRLARALRDYPKPSHLPTLAWKGLRLRFQPSLKNTKVMSMEHE